MSYDEPQRECKKPSDRIGLIVGLAGVFLFVVVTVPMPFPTPNGKAQLVLPVSHYTGDIAPNVESLGDPVYAAAYNACSGAVMRKYGNEWSTPGKFALTSQNLHEVWLFTGWRFTKKDLVVVCKYSVESGRLELFEKFTEPSASR